MYQIDHQAEANLDQRLKNAFKEEFESSSQKVIVLASDVP